MHWPIRKTKKQSRRTKQRKQNARLLTMERLETREVLSGFVEVAVNVNHLELTGDPSSNDITVQETTAYNYKITANNNTHLKLSDGSIVKEHTVNAINGDIRVRLGEGSDRFELKESTRSPNLGDTRSNVYGDLDIENNLGHNTNVISQAHLHGELKIQKVTNVPPFHGESSIFVTDTEVEGDVTIDNQVGGANGDSFTEIRRSVLEGKLTIKNLDGQDVVKIWDSDVGNDSGGNIDIQNGDGGSQVELNSTDDNTNTIYGNLTITNGTNGTQGRAFFAVGILNEVTVRRTDVKGLMRIENGDGDTQIEIQESWIGTDWTQTNRDLTIRNGDGIDVLLMEDSVAYWAVNINHDATGPRAAWGSRTDIGNNQIGAHPLFNGAADALVLHGDNGRDTVRLASNQIRGRVELRTYQGHDLVDVINNQPISVLFIRTGDGDDTVTLDQQTVSIKTDIGLEAGIDALRLKNGTKLQTEAVLDGGAGDNDTVSLDADVEIVGNLFPGFENPAP
jgi:hypothetical protein